MIGYLCTKHLLEDHGGEKVSIIGMFCGVILFVTNINPSYCIYRIGNPYKIRMNEINANL
jgi:hypothetical protein